MRGEGLWRAALQSPIVAEVGSHVVEIEHIHQACGMIAVQAESTIDEALVLLHLRAESLGQSVHDTALDVLDRRISFRVQP